MVKDNPKSKRFPDFFTVYLGAERMPIPPAFLDCLNGVMPENTILRNNLGVRWDVEVEKTEQGTFFHRGWKRFLRDNSINVGEFLVFRYSGDWFDCRVFGKSMCEKIGPPSKEKGKEPVEVKEEHDGDTEVEEDDAGDYIEEEKEDGKYYNEKEEEDDDNDHNEEEDDDDDIVEEAEDDDDDDEGEEKEDDGIRDMLLNNPSFVALYRPGHRLKLRVPLKVIKDNNLELANNIVYQDPEDREWPAEVSVWRDGSTWVGGWRFFCEKNNVKKGDKCICEFVLDKGKHRCRGFSCSHRCARMKVKIIRGHAT